LSGARPFGNLRVLEQAQAAKVERREEIINAGGSIEGQRQGGACLLGEALANGGGR